MLFTLATETTQTELYGTNLLLFPLLFSRIDCEEGCANPSRLDFVPNLLENFV
jgi:hypothetical protein